MMTLRRFNAVLPDVPMSTAWYLSDLAEARGRQELFTRQSPQRLKALRENALIESAISSNRIEGVEIDASRVRAVVMGRPAPRDRNEEEVRGYRDALKLIHETGERLVISEKTVLRLHRFSRGRSADAGRYKTKDVDIIESYPDGRSRVRFKATPASRTPAAMKTLVASWHESVEQRRLHPLLALAAFNLDFLCVHPFRDGNGRASRLLLLLQCYHRPHTNFLLYILKTAYKEIEGRVGNVKAPRGEKTTLVVTAIDRFPAEFTLADVEGACPGVSRDMIRRILRDLRRARRVTCIGRGPGAPWRKEGNTPKRG